MKRLLLFGKEYRDTIMVINNLNEGETNECHNIINKLGGIHNFKEFEFKLWNVEYLNSGLKEAYILSDTKTSKRTSFVNNRLDSSVSKNQIDEINSKSDWLHIAYIDDIECYEKLDEISIPFSIDFCTNKCRKSFANIINKAIVVFDSRERKKLYENILTNTTLVLHDEFGVEVISNNKTLFKLDNEPLKNLNVNGAGDLFAAAFIENYYTKQIYENTKFAMISTTENLIKRKNNEKI